MPTVAELFRTETILWQGRKLVLGRASFATEAAMRDYLEKEALAAIHRNAHLMTPVGLKAQMAAWQEACAAHSYDFGTESFARCMECHQHRCRWFWLVLTQRGLDGNPAGDNVELAEVEGVPDDPNAPCLWRDKGEEILAAWQRLMNPPADPQKAAAQTPAASPSPATS